MFLTYRLPEVYGNILSLHLQYSIKAIPGLKKFLRIYGCFAETLQFYKPQL